MMKIKIIPILLLFLPFSAHSQTFQPALTDFFADIDGGYGAAWGDFDHDGWTDLFLARDGGNLLLKNTPTGFVDVTVAKGLAVSSGLSRGAVWSDLDNDGDLDLLVVNTSGQTEIWQNRRNAPFANVTEVSGVNHRGLGGRAIADLDGDGWNDLVLSTLSGETVVYHNDGDFHFSPVANALPESYGGLGVNSADFDNDHDPDLSVGTVYPQPFHLYENQNQPQLSDVAADVNLSGSARDWSTAWADADHDGDLEVYMARLGANSLYRNDNGLFVDLTNNLGVPGESVGAIWGDYNKDGRLDLYVFQKDGTNLLFQNTGGLNFADVTVSAGNVSGGNDTRDASWIDYDRDGDVDLFLVEANGCRLFRNSSVTARTITVNLTGTVSASDGIGARICLVHNGIRQIREVSGGSALSGQQPLAANFGIGSVNLVDSLIVRWPNGDEQIRLQLQALTNVSVEVVAPHPNLWIDYELVDFGDVHADSTALFSMTIENPAGWQSGDPLTVNNLTIDNPIFSVSDFSPPVVVLPGSTFEVLLAWTPGDTGRVSSALHIHSDYMKSDFPIELRGYGTAPYISLSDTSLVFAPQPLAVPVHQTFQLVNTGTATLTIFDFIEIHPNFTVLTPTPGLIEPGQSLPVTIEFTPADTGWVAAELIIHSDARNFPQLTLGLTGRGLAPEISAAPAVIDFAFVPIDTFAIHTIYLHNPGLLPLTIYDLDFIYPSTVFSIAFEPTQVIAPGQNWPATITFAPQEPLYYSATGIIFSDAYSGNLEFNISGTGSAPSLVAPGQIDFPDPVNFGESYTINASVINNGQAPLRLFGHSVMNASFQVDLITPALIQPGHLLAFDIIFSPLTGGENVGQIEILTNDPTAGLATITLRGFGRAAAISATPLLEFGPVNLNDSRTLNLALANNGNAPLLVSDAYFSAPEFRFGSNWPPEAIAPGSSTAVSTIFQPTTSGAYADTLSFMTNDPEHPAITVLLTGSGVSPAITWSTALLDFGAVYVGQDSTRTLRLTNTGSSAMSIQGVNVTSPAFNLGAGPDYPLELLINQTLNFDLTFRPDAEETYHAELRLFVDFADADQTRIPLSGAGLADQVPPVIHSLTHSLAQVGQTVAVSVAAGDNIGVETAAIYYRPGGDAAFTAMVMTPGTSGYQASLPGTAVTATGLEYFVEAIDSGGNIGRYPVDSNGSIPVYVLNLVRPEFFPANRYRLVSVPLALEQADPNVVFIDELGYYDPAQWRFWEYDGGYREYDPVLANEFAIAPAQGYWLISKESVILDTQPATGWSIPLMPYTLNLASGWHIIGNPFAFPIAWSDVEKPAALDDAVLWAYTDNGYEPAYDLDPWAGYFVENTSAGPVTLTVPPSIGPVLKSAQETFASEEWIQLIADMNNARDAWNLLVFDPAVRSHTEPPEAPGPNVRLAFTPGLAVLADDRPVEARAYPFTISHSAESPQFITVQKITADGLDLTTRIVDETLGNTWDEGSYRFLAQPGRAYSFQLWINASDNAENPFNWPPWPEDIQLLPSFPNPMTATTTIRFYLPNPAVVGINLYTVTGQLAATLSGGEMCAAGFHQRYWDGRRADGAPAPAGMYIVDFAAGGTRLQQRLLYLK